MEGNVKKVCEDIDISQSNSDDGVKVITDKLKLLFAKDTNQAALKAYQSIETYQGPETMSIIEYINK